MFGVHLGVSRSSVWDVRYLFNTQNEDDEEAAGYMRL